MKSLNKCCFIGNLGNAAEVRYLPDGAMTVTLSLAVADDYTSKQTGEKVERTEWVRCIAFGKLAEIIEKYTTKGSKIYAEGKFTTRKWQKDGVDQYTTEVRLENVQLIDSKSSGDRAKEYTQAPAPAQTEHYTAKANGYAPAGPDNFDDYDDGIP